MDLTAGSAPPFSRDELSGWSRKWKLPGRRPGSFGIECQTETEPGDALCNRNREMERTAVSQFALGPDAPPLGLDQALGNR